MPATILSDNGVSSGSAGIKTTGSNDGQLALQTTTAGGTATTAVTIGTDQSVTFAQSANLPNTFGFKNRIINGGMVIDQRNAGAAVTTDNSFPVDRFNFRTVGGGVISFQRSTIVPTGFVNSLALTVTTADSSIAAGDNYQLRQNIEGFNTADLGFGTASAKPVTLSFWVRSSITGTFGGNLVNSATNRSYIFQYTISSANTWEQKTITIAGDTTGTWLTDNGIGITVTWDLGSGTDYNGTANTWSAANYRRVSGNVQLVGTLNATWYVTGVQLEAGSTATSFDFRDYGRELMLCQRYFEVISTNADSDANRYLTAAWTTSDSNCYMPFKVNKRAAPTLTISANGEVYTGSWQSATSVTAIGASAIGATINVTLTSGFTARSVYFVRNQGVTASSEL